MCEVRATAIIAEDDEIFVSYIPLQLPKEERRHDIKRTWDFLCVCPICDDGNGGVAIVAEERRRTISKLQHKLSKLGKRPEPTEQVELYDRLLQVFLHEEQMVWETMVM